MTAKELREKFIKFFVEKGHKEIPSASLIPENDPTTLFVSAGMQPMLTYLLGEPHSLGTRIVDCQKCVRTADIEEVGDNRHQTFFEMLGNWSFGDYFKKEQLEWIFEFLTKEVGIDPNKIYVTVFAGDEKYNLLKDTESVSIWKNLFNKQNINAKDIELGSLENAANVGMQEGRIFYYDQKKNWWSRFNSIKGMPSGEPGGPNSEMFYEFTEIKHDPKYGKYCHPNCDCGRFLEIGNSVFMQFQKQTDESLKELPNKNVDYGGGVERLVMVNNNQPDVFQIDLFFPIIKKIEEISGKKYEDEFNKKPMRVIADHLRAATFIISDGITSSNTEQGYILRRLIRRAIRFGKTLGIQKPFISSMVETVIETLGDIYPEIVNTKNKIIEELNAEEERFSRTLERGLKEFNDFVEKNKNITGKDAFFLYETYGFPWELTLEMANEKNITINEEEFKKALEEHQEKSRVGGEKKFAGGLADHSEIATKYHTATHLLHQALRMVLGETVHQVGSNITAERLRFDFVQSEKLTPEQIKKVEDLVNDQIKKDLPVAMEVMSLAEAKEKGALAFFEQKYSEQVKVYSIDSYSKEVCGGPHVERTGLLGNFKIIKEESCGAGKRRIYAILE